LTDGEFRWAIKSSVLKPRPLNLYIVANFPGRGSRLQNSKICLNFGKNGKRDFSPFAKESCSHETGHFFYNEMSSIGGFGRFFETARTAW
jgi:hypothetical protein